MNSTTREAATRVPGEEVTFYSGGCAIAGTFTEAADPVARGASSRAIGPKPGSGFTIGSLASVLADVGGQRRSFG